MKSSNDFDSDDDVDLDEDEDESFQTLRRRFHSAEPEALEEVKRGFAALRSEYDERRRALDAAEAVSRGGHGHEQTVRGGGGCANDGDHQSIFWGPGGWTRRGSGGPKYKVFITRTPNAYSPLDTLEALKLNTCSDSRI